MYMNVTVAMCVLHNLSYLLAQTHRPSDGIHFDSVCVCVCVCVFGYYCLFNVVYYNDYS